MGLSFDPLTDDHLDEAIGFLRGANPFCQHTWGWDTGRFIDWRWGGNTLRADDAPGFFERHGTVVRRDGAAAGLVISEVGADDHCILTAGEDEVLLEASLERLVERHTGDELILYPADDATWIHAVLARHGFRQDAIAGLEWGYDIDSDHESVTPPDGFAVESLSDDPEVDFVGIGECLEGAFGRRRDRVRILRSLAGNPMFRSELNIVGRSPDGRIAAYCRGTVDPESGVCGIDPVATHPDFQGRGLGTAVVRACFAAQYRLGGTTSYIGSAPEGSAGSRLYRSLGPISVTSYSTWTRPLRGAGADA